MQELFWKICLLLLGLEIVACVLFYAYRKKKFDCFDPFYWASAVYFAIMVFAPYTWVLNGQVRWNGAVVLENLPTATLFFGVSYLAFVVGCLAKSKKAVGVGADAGLTEWQEDTRTAEMIRSLAWIAFVLGFSMSMMYLRYRGRSLLTALSLGQLGTFTEDLSTSSSFWFLNQGTRILMSSGLLLLIYEKKHPMLAKIAYALTFMLVLSSGQRNQLMVVVLAPIVYWYMSKKKRPKLRSILIFVLVFVVVLGYVGLWRGSFRTGGELERQEAESVFTAFMVNIEVFFPYYTLITTVPQAFPHQWGMSYLYTFIQFIPRFLWPGKPVSSVTNVTIAMFGPMWAAAGPAYPNFGEMYLDFGVIGMVIGMLIFGRVCAWMYQKGLSGMKGRMGLISFSLFLPYLFQYITRGHFPSVATEVLFLWGPLWVIQLVLRSSRKKQ